VSRYEEYIHAKNIAYETLRHMYHRKMFRAHRLQSYGNIKRSEAKFIDEFRSVFGDAKGTVIVIGDFEQKEHRKWIEPVKGKGFRKMFRKAEYEVLLADEFRTSCRCSHCQSMEGVCETFRKVKNKKPKSKDKHPVVMCHGLLKCKTCKRLWNRDLNAALNIYRIARNALQSEERQRPEYVRRTNSATLSTVTSSGIGVGTITEVSVETIISSIVS